MLFRELDIANINNSLQDDVSKDIFTNRLMYSVTKDVMYLRKVCFTADGCADLVNVIESNKEKKRILFGAGNWGNWISCLHHLMKYERNERITFKRITPEWVQGFRDYIDRDAIAWDHDSRKRVKGKPLSENFLENNL